MGDASSMPPTRAPSAASTAKKSVRTENWLAKTGNRPALPYDWTEKEVTLQQLVDIGFLSRAEAAAKAGATVAPAAGADGDAAAAAAEPDLASVKVLLYSRFKAAPIKETNTEDWRTLGPLDMTTLERRDPPVLFSLPLCVERGAIGELMQKRLRSWSKQEELSLEVQLLVYRAAFNFCVDLPLTLESIGDEKFEAANALLDTIGAAQLSKEEVLAKAFPAFELSGERRTWFARSILPKKLSEAADTLSLLTLPYDNAYPSAWFSGAMAESRFLELEGGDEGGDGDSPRELAILLAQALS